MPCEHYKDALIEAAATGTEPQGKLRAHVAECASCRKAFAQEQSLFAAIDDGLYTAANTEVPPSLLPRIRAGLDEVTFAHPRWSSSWFALAGAAVVAVVLFFAVTIRQNNLRIPPNQSAANQHAVSPTVPSAESPLSARPSEKVDSSMPPRALAARNSVGPEETVNSKSTPEILVPRDQEILLASYAQQWSFGKHAPLVARDADETSVVLLEVVPIQIAELDVKPLAEGNSQ